MLAGHPDLFNRETHQLLTLRKGEFIQATAYALSEAGDPMAQAVLLREQASMFDQHATFFLKKLTSAVYFLGASMHFSQFEQSALIEIDQALPFSCGTLDFTVETF